MRKYKDIYTNRIPSVLSYPWNRHGLKLRLAERINSMNLCRWSSNAYYPPIDVLAVIADVSGYSTAYLLGQTNIKCPVDNPDGKPRDIPGIMERQHLTVRDVAERAGTKPDTIARLISAFPDIRTNSFIALSDALRVSTDYLLGLTDRETWGQYQTIGDIAPGTPAFLEEAEGDKDPSEGVYILAGTDGESIYFPDGSVRTKDDEYFEGKIAVAFPGSGMR